MSRSRKVGFGVLAFVFLALAVSTPGLIQGHRQKKAVETTFSAYARALVSGDYSTAYQFGGDAFGRSISLEAFVETQNKTQSSFGKIKSMENKGTFVHSWGSPMEWVADIEARQVYEKGEVDLVCEFHFENESWKLFGCKQISRATRGFQRCSALPLSA